MLKNIFQRIKNFLNRPAPYNSILMRGELYAKVFRINGNIEDKGLVATRSVTTAAVNNMVKIFVSTAGGKLSDYDWHAWGSSTVAENITNTALTTEVNATARSATGTRTTGSAANIFQTVCTRTCTTAGQIGEHGLFSSSGGATLWDRSVFGAINVSSGDSVQFTYNLTISQGG